MAVQAKPEGFHSVTPYLIIDGAAAAIRWYCDALGASEVMRLPMPATGQGAGGAAGEEKVAHAELRIGDSMVMLSDEWPEYGKLAPTSRGGATSGLMIYLEDVEAAFERAVAAGAKVDQPVSDQFYGDRSGSFTDPFGHSWTVATHVEDVPEEELQQRMAAWSEQQQAAQAGEAAQAG